MNKFTVKCASYFPFLRLYNSVNIAITSLQTEHLIWQQLQVHVQLVGENFTYLLSPRSTVLLEKLTGLQLAKKFPAFYGTRRFITAFTSACHLSVSWACSIQSIPPHPTSWRSILILSYHLRLSLPSGLFTSGFPTKILYTSLLSPIRATCPVHLILLDLTPAQYWVRSTDH
jgi:hypothetical protein